jgi:hypothetical protein
MKEKLKLSHLAAYLPYGVTIYKPSAIGRKTFVLDVEGLHLMETLGFEHYKLVLRNYPQTLSGTIDPLQYDRLKAGNSMDMYDLTVGDFRELLKQHVDVFGLINRGLAVNINYLKL